MIFIDDNITSPLNIIGGKLINGLRNETQADIIISNLSAPPINKKIIDNHIKVGAEFITIIKNKSEPEVVRKNNFWLADRVLLIPYEKEIIEFAESMCNKSSSYDFIIYNDEREISSYIMLENSIICGLKDKSKWMRTLSTLPIAYNDMETIESVTKKIDNNLITSIVYLTDTDREDNKSGKGKSICARLRKYFGIPDGWNLTLKMEGEK